MTSGFEYEIAHEGEGYKKIEADLAGYAVTFERHEDWLTTAYWKLPDEYNFDDFLQAIENCFKVAEEHGYENEGYTYEMVFASPAFQDIQEVEYIRPLETEDFEEIGTSVDEIDFIRLGGDLAHFTFNRSDRQVGLLFYEKPHQTKSAFRFMAELLPSQANLEACQIGSFILQLPR